MNGISLHDRVKFKRDRENLRYNVMVDGMHLADLYRAGFRVWALLPNQAGCNVFVRFDEKNLDRAKLKVKEQVEKASCRECHNLNEFCMCGVNEAPPEHFF